MSDDKFQAIVVGGGVAGCAAAYRLAKAGHEVLLIERGKSAGSKNVSGGRIYAYALEQLMPGEWQSAPLEREIKREAIMMMTPESGILVNSMLPGLPDKMSYSVLRAKLDEWMAKKAEDAGAMLATGFCAENIIMQDGKAVGVKTGDEELYADIIILADGVNSLLAQGVGLGKPITAENTAVAVKMVIGLTEEQICDRFNVPAGQGMAMLMVGDCTKGVSGGGFLYTNKNSVSLGLVLDSAGLKAAKENIADLIEELTQHPAIAPYLKDGKLLEYGAHLIPEGGLASMPKLYGEGLMVIGDAAGMVVNSAITVRGMDYGILSGIAAADAAHEAIEAGDCSAKKLSSYESAIKQTVLKDMETFKHAHAFMATTPDMFSTYPKVAEAVMTSLFTITGQPARRAPLLVKDAVFKNASLWQMFKDGLKGARSI